MCTCSCCREQISARRPPEHFPFGVTKQFLPGRSAWHGFVLKVRGITATISSMHFFQLDSPLPTSRTGPGILRPEEHYVREKSPKYIVSAPRTGVLLPLEDGLRQMICTRVKLHAPRAVDRQEDNNGLNCLFPPEGGTILAGILENPAY
jgi:hypothetical protein